MRKIDWVLCAAITIAAVFAVGELVFRPPPKSLDEVDAATNAYHPLPSRTTFEPFHEPSVEWSGRVVVWTTNGGLVYLSRVELGLREDGVVVWRLAGPAESSNGLNNPPPAPPFIHTTGPPL